MKQLGFPKYFLVHSEDPPHKEFLQWQLKSQAQIRMIVQEKRVSVLDGYIKKRGSTKSFKNGINSGVLKEDQFDESDMYRTGII